MCVQTKKKFHFQKIYSISELLDMQSINLDQPIFELSLHIVQNLNFRSINFEPVYINELFNKIFFWFSLQKIREKIHKCNLIGKLFYLNETLSISMRALNRNKRPHTFGMLKKLTEFCKCPYFGPSLVPLSLFLNFTRTFSFAELSKRKCVATVSSYLRHILKWHYTHPIHEGFSSLNTQSHIHLFVVKCESARFAVVMILC